jgi:hypothetical protein
MHSHCWRCRLYCGVNRCPSIMFNVPINLDSHVFIHLFMAGDLYTGATQSSCPLAVWLAARHHHDSNSGLMLVGCRSQKSTPVVAEKTHLVLHSCKNSGSSGLMSLLWCCRVQIQKSTPVVLPVTTGLAFAVSAHNGSLPLRSNSCFVWSYLTAGPWSFGLPRRHSCNVITTPWMSSGGSICCIDQSKNPLLW